MVTVTQEVTRVRITAKLMDVDGEFIPVGTSGTATLIGSDKDHYKVVCGDRVAYLYLTDLPLYCEGR